MRLRRLWCGRGARPAALGLRNGFLRMMAAECESRSPRTHLPALDFAGAAELSHDLVTNGNQT
eukprot:5607076-Amphidinium_carterae.1